jgi:hypothetical protein
MKTTTQTMAIGNTIMGATGQTTTMTTTMTTTTVTTTSTASIKQIIHSN